MIGPSFTPGPNAVVPVDHLGATAWAVQASDGDLIAVGCLRGDALLFAASPDGYEAGAEAIVALNAMMDAWFDYHDAHSLTQPVTGAAGNAFDKALAAREKLEAFVAKSRGETA